MSTSETPAVIVTIKTGQNGYSPEQVSDRAMTLGDLIEKLQQLIDDDGVDPSTKVVVGGYGRGAVWEPATGTDLFEPEDNDEFIY